MLKDLKKYQRLPQVFDRNHQFFTDYPDLLAGAAHTLLTVDGVDKKSKEKTVRQSFVKRRSPFGLMGDAFKLWRAFE